MSMSNTPDSPAEKPDHRMSQGGNFWPLFTPGIWKVLHAVLHHLADSLLDTGRVTRIEVQRGYLPIEGRQSALDLFQILLKLVQARDFEAHDRLLQSVIKDVITLLWGGKRNGESGDSIKAGADRRDHFPEYFLFLLRGSGFRLPPPRVQLGLHQCFLVTGRFDQDDFPQLP